MATLKSWSARSRAACRPAMPPPTTSASNSILSVDIPFPFVFPDTHQRRYAAFLLSAPGGAQFRYQLVHLVHFFDKGLGADGADARETKPSGVQTFLPHHGVNPVYARRQGRIGAFIGTFHTAAHDDDAVDPLFETVQIEMPRETSPVPGPGEHRCSPDNSCGPDLWRWLPDRRSLPWPISKSLPGFPGAAM